MEEKKFKRGFLSFEQARDRGVELVNRMMDFVTQFTQKFQSQLKTVDAKRGSILSSPLLLAENEQPSPWDVKLENQMKKWKENPSWIDQVPEIKISVPKGSFCNLNAIFQVGLPPDAIYNIVTDPDNQRVFKNIKEVIYRKVLVDEGLRQVVEVEQAAWWRFLWLSGTLCVHVFVDQNRENYTVKFKQGKSGFMKRFEGCWTLEPLFVDKHLCSSGTPQNLMDYEACSGGKGRVATLVKLEQLVQPSLVPPPPISWYVRGITSNALQMLVVDLLAEAARMRKNGNTSFAQEPEFKTDELGCSMP